MPDPEKIPVGRLALRLEGDAWAAYYAHSDTMKNAQFLGSINVNVIHSDEVKEGFKSLMKQIVADLLEEQTGHRPIWDPSKPAPEHERAGRA